MFPSGLKTPNLFKLQCTNKMLHWVKSIVLQAPSNTTKKVITRTIWILSLVSLCTDIASEMLYPVMPVFLQKIGFSIVLIGILEGLAEAVAGLSKIYFGQRSDQAGKRLPFVQLGYTLSAISKPMMGIFIFPAWIFLARTMDRIGKGIRTGARDALLSDEATPATKGRVFGFHRSLDTLGAAIGPAVALLYLYYNPGNYRTLFFIAFVPGLLAIIASLLIKEKSKKAFVKTNNTFNFSIFTRYWKASSATYKKLVAGLLFFALFNSTDVFLLLQMKANGLDDTAVIGVYIFYNLVYAMLAYPIGMLADKFGLKKIFLLGLVLFSVVYFSFAFNQTIPIYLLLISLYGIYAAATEGIAKAWISNVVDKSETASAIGTYAGFQSIAALIASSVGGMLWYYFGFKVTFLVTASATMLAVFYLSSISIKRANSN